MINIHLDTSGSMMEMGKDSGSLYVVRSIQEYCRAYSLETTLHILDGTLMNNLNQLYSTSVENSILVSDGLFNCEEKEIFDIAIAIGIDSDTKSLKKIAGKPFECDDLIPALEYLIFHKDIAPDTTQSNADDDESQITK